MRLIKDLYRLLQIFSIMFKYGVLNQKPRGIRLRKALEDLGPIYIKFGQVLSTRFDILPEDIALELVKLQDQVPPFSGKIAKNMIEKAFKLPIHEIFKSFDITPLASASVAQVHAAVLEDKMEVIVKILRPGIHKLINRDIRLLKTVSFLVTQFWAESKNFKPLEIVAEFEKVLSHELDLIREAANASQLRRNFSDSTLLYVPKIYWPLTKHNILVMEQVFGIPISNITELKKQNFNLKQLAKNLIEAFLTQAFRDCFFHADMHPGNILVSDKDLQNPMLLAVDFGIMGVLSKQDQRYLVENLLAFMNRDYRRVAELHAESEWIPKTTRIDEFEAAIRAVSEPILERSLKDISFGELLFKLFQLASQYHINIQPQLILLQKTLVNIEGLSRQLDPDMDLFTTAKPFLEDWIEDQVGIPSLIRRIKAYSPYWIEKLPELPNLLYAALNTLTTNHNNANLNPLQPIMTNPQQNDQLSAKDICIGVLLGISLSLAGLIVWGYF